MTTGSARVLSGEMSQEFFPVSFKELGVRIVADDLHDGRRIIGGVEVSSFPLNHPGGCFGYCFAGEGENCLCHRQRIGDSSGRTVSPLGKRRPAVPHARGRCKPCRTPTCSILDAQYDEQEYVTEERMGAFLLFLRH